MVANAIVLSLLGAILFPETGSWRYKTQCVTQFNIKTVSILMLIRSNCRIGRKRDAKSIFQLF